MSGSCARAFVALPLGEELGRRVGEAVARALGPGSRDWKLPRAEGLHLTLFFLGPRTRAWLPELGRELGPALLACAPPHLALGAAGAFPDLRRPRVLWLGVEERACAGRLAAVRAALLATLRRAGVDTRVEEEQPFRPHMTVARPRGRARVPEAFVRLARAEPFETPAAVLFESVPGPGGSHYEPLARFPFGADSAGKACGEE